MLSTEPLTVKVCLGNIIFLTNSVNDIITGPSSKFCSLDNLGHYIKGVITEVTPDPPPPSLLIPRQTVSVASVIGLMQTDFRDLVFLRKSNVVTGHLDIVDPKTQ